MRKGKRLVSFGLILCLALGLVPAAGAVSAFPAVNAYPAGYYRDVPQGVWYADAAQLCYETGLITGPSANTFAPDRAVTVGEAAAVAAREPDPEEPDAWWVWPGNVRLRRGGTAAQARSLVQDVEDRGTAYVSLESTAQSTRVLQQALPTLTQRPYTVRLQTEAS